MPLLPTITDTAEQLRSGRLTSVALTEASVAAADRLDLRLGTYLARFDDYALGRAHEADGRHRRGDSLGPLDGMPIGVKDVMAMSEGPTTAQSLVLDRGRGRDATVVARLKAAGAIITGKTTTMEFAYGMPDAAKPFPFPRSPWDADRYAGGSSSGSASGVSAGLFLAALGSDTGGSIRIPAAFCGVSGLKPTFGLVPKTGCVPLGYSLDHVGPLARSALDCADVLEAIAGPEPSDPDSSQERFTPPTWTGDLSGRLIGVVRDDHFPADREATLDQHYDDALEVLRGCSASLREVRLPLWREVVTADIITIGSEALAYHRNDLVSRWEDYFVASRAVISTGAMVSGADYVQAQRVRRVAQQAVSRLFEDVDLIVTPTAPGRAPRFAELTSADGQPDLEQMCADLHRVLEPARQPCCGHPHGPHYRRHAAFFAGRRRRLSRLGGASRRRCLPAGDRLAPSRAAPRSGDDPGMNTTLNALLAALRLPASDAEAQAYAATYVTLRARVDALYEVDEARYADPALPSRGQGDRAGFEPAARAVTRRRTPALASATGLPAPGAARHG